MATTTSAGSGIGRMQSQIAHYPHGSDRRDLRHSSGKRRTVEARMIRGARSDGRVDISDRANSERENTSDSESATSRRSCSDVHHAKSALIARGHGHAAIVRRIASATVESRVNQRIFDSCVFDESRALTEDLSALRISTQDVADAADDRHWRSGCQASTTGDLSRTSKSPCRRWRCRRRSWRRSRATRKSSTAPAPSSTTTAPTSPSTPTGRWWSWEKSARDQDGTDYSDSKDDRSPEVIGVLTSQTRRNVRDRLIISKHQRCTRRSTMNLLPRTVIS